MNLPEPEPYWPLSLPLVQRNSRVEFAAGITVLVGENGSGKSTLLEALAIAADLPAAGSPDHPTDDVTLTGVRPLAERMRLEWTARSRRGLFLRAEDFLDTSGSRTRGMQSCWRMLHACDWTIRICLSWSCGGFRRHTWVR